MNLLGITLCKLYCQRGEDINSSGAEDKTEYDFRVTQDGSSMEDADQNIWLDISLAWQNYKEM